MADRVDLLDVRFFVTAVLIQRQVGGDLAEVLDKIGNVIRERIKLFGTVQALTAEGRLSGYVLLALPVIVLARAAQHQPRIRDDAVLRPAGKMMLTTAIVMQLMGWATDQEDRQHQGLTTPAPRPDGRAPAEVAAMDMNLIMLAVLGVLAIALVVYSLLRPKSDDEDAVRRRLWGKRGADDEAEIRAAPAARRPRASSARRIPSSPKSSCRPTTRKQTKLKPQARQRRLPPGRTPRPSSSPASR
jgi:Flp pilus assembly protein TadB